MIRALRQFVVSLVPKTVRSTLREWQSLTLAQRRIYLRRRLAGRQSDPLPARVNAESRIVFICFGNVLRSPMAEALYREALRSRGRSVAGISSAGVRASSPPRDAHRDGRAVAPEFGVSLDAHRSTLLTQELVDRSDLLVVMDHLHEAMLIEQFPDAESRVVLLGEFDPERTRLGVAIEDPYGHGEAAVRFSYDRIGRAISVMTAQLLARALVSTWRSESRVHGEYA